MKITKAGKGWIVRARARASAVWAPQSRAGALLLRPAVFVDVAVRRRLTLHAAALSYTTLFSLVPLFAAMLLVVKGIGLSGKEAVLVEEFKAWLARLLPLLGLEGSAEAMAQLAVQKLHDVAARLNARSVGIVGGGFLFATAVGLLTSAEAAMNDLWGIARGRSLLRQLLVYAAVIVATPLLLLVALSTRFIAQSDALVRWLSSLVPFGWFETLLQGVLIPTLLMTAALALFYRVMPHARVRWLPALLGGAGGAGLLNALVVGFAWALTLSGKAEKLSYVYGAFALVPLLLLFLYLGWLVVLLGGALAFALQEAPAYAAARRGGRIPSP